MPVGVLNIAGFFYDQLIALNQNMIDVGALTSSQHADHDC
jgi:hypothetical protein